MSRLNSLLLAPPFHQRGGAPTLPNFTSSLGLQQVSLELELEPEPVLLLALVELVPQQVSLPLWLLASVPPWLCNQSPLRQY
jgi:hypothetical protein